MSYNENLFERVKKMKQTVSEHDFIEAFRKMGRESQFSYEGKKALFAALEELEQGDPMNGRPSNEMELDVIALCCDFAEYACIEDFWKEYNKDDYPDHDAIQEATWYIDIDDVSFIIQQF
jgi:hypothetical protein